LPPGAPDESSAMNDEPSPQCPTPTGHKRLEEVHRFWHECAEGYQDPEEFRIKLNACIQAARNLTFALQKEKDLIPDFNNWYPAWQETMKADPVMKWLHDARTHIVHKGDLETQSQAIVRVQIDYSDAGQEVAEGLPQPFSKDTGGDAPKFNTNPMLTLEEILAKVDELHLPTRILRESTLSIERRWVDTDIPNMELLDVLAHVYGVLNQIIHDAHDRAGLSHSLMVDVDGEPVPVPEIETEEGRLPCMVTSRAIRTINLRLIEGKVATGGKMWSIEPDQAGAERAARKYGLDKVEKLEAQPESLFDLLPVYISSAQAIAQSGEEHGWFMFFFRGRTLVGQQILAVRDAADKRDLSQRVAEIVAINRIDGVIEIGEVWQAPITPDSEGAFVRPAVHPDRTEAITIWAETASGLKRSVMIPITRRRLRKPVVGNVVEVDTETAKNNFLEPIRRVWATWPKTETEP
jgi:hypothetical protein